MKILNIILRGLLVLLLISPILGVFGIFPEPTRDLYNSDRAFQFIQVLMDTKYINYIMATVFAICIVLIIKNQMAIVALLLAPITLNIIMFHAFLDGGLLTPGAIMANVLVLINLYFLWVNRNEYKKLWTTNNGTDSN